MKAPHCSLSAVKNLDTRVIIDINGSRIIIPGRTRGQLASVSTVQSEHDNNNTTKRFHQGTKEPLDLHSAQRHVDSRAAYLDSDSGVQDADCCLERLQEAVLVREHAVLACLDTEADTYMDVLLLTSPTEACEAREGPKS